MTAGSEATIQYLPSSVQTCPPAVQKKVEAASELSLEILDRSMESLFKANLTAANDNIEDLEGLEERCKEIRTMALRQKGPIALAIGQMAESVRRVGEYAINISETVINYLVGTIR